MRAGAVQHPLAARNGKTGGEGGGRFGGKLFEAVHLAATIAVEMGVMVIIRGRQLETPGAGRTGDALGNALGDQPVEGTVERYPVRLEAGCRKGAGKFVLGQGLLACLQDFDHRNAGAGGASAVSVDQLSCRNGVGAVDGGHGAGSR